MWICRQSNRCSINLSMPIDYYTPLHPRTAVIADFLCMRTKRSDFSLLALKQTSGKYWKLHKYGANKKKQLQFDEALNAEFYRFFFLVWGFLEANPCGKNKLNFLPSFASFKLQHPVLFQNSPQGYFHTSPFPSEHNSALKVIYERHLSWKHSLGNFLQMQFDLAATSIFNYLLPPHTLVFSSRTAEKSTIILLKCISDVKQSKSSARNAVWARTMNVMMKYAKVPDAWALLWRLKPQNNRKYFQTINLSLSVDSYIAILFTLRFHSMRTYGDSIADGISLR